MIRVNMSPKVLITGDIVYDAVSQSVSTPLVQWSEGRALRSWAPYVHLEITQ